MKIEFDPNNPQDVAQVKRLLDGGEAPYGQTTAPAPAPAAAAVSQADFSAAVQNYAKANSPKAAKAKLAEYGFGKVGDVPAERYAEIMQALAV